MAGVLSVCISNEFVYNNLGNNKGISSILKSSLYEKVDRVDSEASSDNVNESKQDTEPANGEDTDLSVSVDKEETENSLEQDPKNTSSASSEAVSTMEDSSDTETPDDPPANRSSSGVNDVEDEER